jgi:hypothetical protein
MIAGAHFRLQMLPEKDFLPPSDDDGRQRERPFE